MPGTSASSSALNREIGLTVPLTTVDQPTPEMLENGSIPGLHKTASFGSRSLERLATLREHQPTGPLMCSEFWDGWFDNWGAHHHTTPVDQAAQDLDDLLSAGASVNVYMFHGGTNFGFTNGANDKGVFQPIVTSYDYDAPLDEAGDPTAKYWAFREVLARYTRLADDDVPAKRREAPALTARLERAVALAEAAHVLGDGVGARSPAHHGRDRPLRRLRPVPHAHRRRRARRARDRRGARPRHRLARRRRRSAS